MDPRQQKLQNLQAILEACRKHKITFKTANAAGLVKGLVLKFGLSEHAEKEYVRIIVDALERENRTGKEFSF